MMDVFVARQPIFDKKKKIYGYELLFRSGMENAFPDLDGDIATSNLLSSSFFSVGIEKIAGGRKAFINFTETLMLRGTPTLLPCEAVIVELLETVDPGPLMVNACRQLKDQGYQLALDDFIFDEAYAELLPLVDIVKVDFRQTGPEQIGPLLKRLHPFHCQLLAEKIETYEEFNLACKLGFSYFQGYFFAKPEVLKNKEIPQNKLSMMRILHEANSNEFDTAALEQLISGEVAISYKLLAYLNSAYFARITPLKSIRQALSFLGERGVRLFVSLIATSRLAEDKPSELVRLSIIRSRFLEQLGEHVGCNSGELFLLGLFSLIDAMLDNPMDVLVTRLPVSDHIRQALVERSGPLARFLLFIECLEYADWETAARYQQDFSLDGETLVAFQLDAICWANSFDSSL